MLMRLSLLWRQLPVHPNALFIIALFAWDGIKLRNSREVRLFLDDIVTPMLTRVSHSFTLIATDQHFAQPLGAGTLDGLPDDGARVVGHDAGGLALVADDLASADYGLAYCGVSGDDEGDGASVDGYVLALRASAVLSRGDKTEDWPCFYPTH